jgi:membrane-associated phospholipid phosphatase
LRTALEDANRLDMAVYAAIARTPTPQLDRVMRHLSRAADYSRVTALAAGVLAFTGGATGRRAARTGLISVAVTSAVVNAVLKPLARRHRPGRAASMSPVERHVPMPGSTSLPSGHAASAFSFATGVGHVSAPAGAPLRILATLVGYSRVHTGVHYPGDVVAGALVGTAVAEATAHALDRRSAPTHA